MQYNIDQFSRAYNQILVQISSNIKWMQIIHTPAIYYTKSLWICGFLIKKNASSDKAEDIVHLITCYLIVNDQA